MGSDAETFRSFEGPLSLHILRTCCDISAVLDIIQTYLAQVDFDASTF